MSSKYVKDSVEILKEIRTELHGKAEGSVEEKLDKAIGDLENIQDETPDKLTPVVVLTIIGAVLDLIPTIADVIKALK
jgi:hypothetical protein